MKKKMLSLVLVGMFALGAVACGGGGGTTDGATSGATTGAGGATSAPTEATS